jgi:hypothetical protein
MKFTIAKLRHERFGQSSERSAILEVRSLAKGRRLTAANHHRSRPVNDHSRGLRRTHTKDGQMKRVRFTEEQIIGALKEHEAGAKTADLARKIEPRFVWLQSASRYGACSLSDASTSPRKRTSPPRSPSAIAMAFRILATSMPTKIAVLSPWLVLR